jgi:hypothetical protein
MFLRISNGLSIDNLRNYPGEIAAQLEELLTLGAMAHLDANRPNFYDVATSTRSFFIYAEPGSGKVILLATWPVATRAEQPEDGAMNVALTCEPIVALSESSGV